jgi:hypothetical protein
MAGTAASAQTGPGVGYDRAALTQAICRQYAAAQEAMPYDTMYAQCMYARATERRVSRHRPIPLVIKASCRVRRFIMEVPDRPECAHAEQLKRCGPLGINLLVCGIGGKAIPSRHGERHPDNAPVRRPA